MTNRINIIVPVYGDWKSLGQCIDSLIKYYAEKPWTDVYLVNDCGPEADALEKSIISKIKKVQNFKYYRNKTNLGFIKNCNNAVFKIVSDKKADVLLLNSDTVVTKNFLEEMLRILYSQENIGIVNPRSNNATVWSVPMDGRYADSPHKSYNLWRRQRKTTPEKYTSSLTHGFCMLIRRKIIDEIGLFDEVYGKGYGEENDFAMRAFDSGWISASANYAFVFHLGSRSFGDDERKKLGEHNMRILLKRYPDYMDRVREYVSTTVEPFSVHKNTTILKTAHILFKAIEHGHYNGYFPMVKKATRIISSRFLPNKIMDGEPRVHVWSHQISYTGAPMVLYDLLRSWKKVGLPKNTAYQIPEGASIDHGLMSDLRNEGFDFREANYLSTHFNEGDIVLLNSSAYPDWLLKKIISGLESGKIKHLFFYIHEDDDSMLGILKKHTQELSGFIKNNSVTVYAPSTDSVKNWQSHFGVKKNIYTMSGHISYDKNMFKPKQPSEFDKLNFIIAGSSEPHKGQLSVLYALVSFYNEYFKKSIDTYRDFSLTIAGVNGSGGYYENFIENVSKELQDRVRLIRRPDVSQMHQTMAQCNLTITYSIKDSFSIATMEGMAFGHPIIRSESSGRQEQFNGKNGWAVDTTQWGKLVTTIEEVANKTKTSNKDLVRMSQESIKIAKNNYNERYRIIDDISRVLE